MAKTFDAYQQFDPARAERLTGLQEASSVFDGLACSDLTSVLTIMSGVCQSSASMRAHANPLISMVI